MEPPSYVVTGGRRGLKKKSYFLPEIYVENEEGVRHRSSSIVKHSTPNQGQNTSDGSILKNKEPLNTTVDSGFDDWSVHESSYNSNCTHNSTNSSYRTPSAKPVEASLWDSFTSPIQDLKHQFKSRPSFVDDRVKIKLNVETLVTVCLGVVMFSSIVFSVYMGANILGSPNGKYKSIKYGVNRKIENMRKEGRLLDYDIKDEYGNTLGGKRAAIQFAYDQKYGKQENEKPAKPSTLRKRAAPTQPKVAETKVEDPVPTKKEEELSIAELSKKIDELNALLQNDLELAVSQLDIDEKIASMRDRKKDLIKKIKPKNSVRPDKPANIDSAKVDPDATVELSDTPLATGGDVEADGADTDSAADIDEAVPEVVKEKSRDSTGKTKKPGKTKVQNPLTKSLPKKSKAKKPKAASKLEDVKVDQADDQHPDVEDHPGGEDVEDVDPGLQDYPDDPTFRGKLEI